MQVMFLQKNNVSLCLKKPSLNASPARHITSFHQRSEITLGDPVWPKGGEEGRARRARRLNRHPRSLELHSMGRYNNLLVIVDQARQNRGTVTRGR